jgi:hypothetical protein
MATQLDSAQMILPAPTDSIRVVPLYVPAEIGAPVAGVPAGPAPLLTYRSGPLISAVEVFTVYWGAAWNTAPQSGLSQKVNQFFDTILSSALIDQLAEYSVPAYKIGHGKHVGTVNVTTPTLRHAVSDRAIQHMLQHELATAAGAPQPTPNTLYFVYLPPGVSVSQGGGRSCQVFCGYHSDILGKIFYAVMPYPGCTGCAGGLAVLEALTSTSSHELCEAITDAIPGQGWYDDVHGEIGDICAWKTKTVGAYTVQLEWSNKAKACV